MNSRFKTEIENLKLNHKKVFVAISGGVDSVVLTHLLLEQNIKPILLHCNFNLRGLNSELDETFVKTLGEQHQLDVFTKTFDTKTFCKTQNLTIQEGARKLRYDWFATFLKDEHAILCTAHHLDDQIETFLINLLRGTGLKGLTGIPSNTRQIIRPLLSFSKSEILDFAQKNRLAFREDESNATDNYLRNRLRHHLIPDLEAETVNFKGKMNQLLGELNEIDQYLDKQVLDLKLKVENNKSIDLNEIDSLPDFLLVRLFKNFALNRKKIGEFKKFMSSKNGSIFKTKSHTFLKHLEQIEIQENQVKTRTDDFVKIKKTDSSIKMSNHEFNFKIIDYKSSEHFAAHIAYLDADKITFPLKIRLWQAGDKIQPLGMKGKKLISDILKDKKINRFDREHQLVVLSNNVVIWLVDLVINDQYSLTSDTKSVLTIEHHALT